MIKRKIKKRKNKVTLGTCQLREFNKTGDNVDGNKKKFNSKNKSTTYQNLWNIA